MKDVFLVYDKSCFYEIVILNYFMSFSNCDMLDAMFAETAGSVPLLLCVVLCGFASMNFMTAPSISMEGISLWHLQSLPIDTWKIDDSGLT